MDNTLYHSLINYVSSIQDTTKGNDAEALINFSSKDGVPYRIIGKDNVVFKISSPKYSKPQALKVYLEKAIFQSSIFSNNNSALQDLQDFLPEGFQVLNPFCKLEADNKNTALSAVVTSWIEGKSLSDILFEYTSISQKESLSKLVLSLKETIRLFRKNKISNVDFDLDNFLLQSNGDIKVVDYDGWQCNNSKLSDDYTWLLLYVYVLALSISPNLYKEYGKRDIFFFTHTSLCNPSTSKLIHDLKQLEETRPIIPYLLQYYNTEHEIPELEDILEGHFPVSRISITQTPKIVLEGASVQLDWQCENVDELYINDNFFSEEGCSLTITAALNQTTSFLLKNKFDEVKFDYTTEVWGLPKVEKLELSNEKIQRNSSVTISWHCIYSTKQMLKINGISKEVDAVGSTNIICMEDAYEISLEIIGVDDMHTDFVSRSVLVFDPVSIEYFYADLPFQNAGLPFRLNWNVAYAQRVRLTSDDGWEQDVTTLKELFIQGVKCDTTYTLIAQNAMFTEAKIVKMNIIGLTPYPKPKFLIRKK